MQNGLYQVSDLKQSIRGILTGVNLDKVVDFKGKCYRAGTNLLLNADVPEMSNVYSINVYDGVFDYASVPNLFGSLIHDVRPQGVDRSEWTDTPIKKPLQDFDLMKQRLSSGIMVSFEQRNTDRIMRIAGTRPQARLVIDTFSQTTGWVASGNASSLAQDQTVYYQDPASMRFNLAAGGTQGILSRTYTSQTDFTYYDGVGEAFLALWLPTGAAAALTSIVLRLGNDATHYREFTALVSSGAFVGSFKDGDFFLVPFDLSSYTTTGTVTITQVDFAALLFNYVSATQLSNVRVGALFAALPSPYEVVHETQAIFVPTGTTTPQKTITLDTDMIILADAGYNLYVYECAREIALGKGGTITSAMIAAIDLELHGNGKKPGLYSKFRSDNPSDVMKVQGSYYY